jgi:hypothetical protein
MSAVDDDVVVVVIIRVEIIFIRVMPPKKYKISEALKRKGWRKIISISDPIPLRKEEEEDDKFKPSGSQETTHSEEKSEKIFLADEKPIWRKSGKIFLLDESERCRKAKGRKSEPVKKSIEVITLSSDEEEDPNQDKSSEEGEKNTQRSE